MVRLLLVLLIRILLEAIKKAAESGVLFGTPHRHEITVRQNAEGSHA